MTAKDSLAELGELISDARHANVVIAANSDDEDDEEELVFQRLTLAGPVSKQFLEEVSATVAQLGERTLQRYEAGYKLDDDELCYIQLSESDLAKEAVESFASLDQVELFRESDDIIDNLRFYAVIVQQKSRQAVFFRTFSPKNELTRSGVTPLILRGDAYNRLEQKVFLFDDKVDCVAWGDYLFIQNTTQFQRIFGYFKALIAKADKTIDTVTARITIENLDEFKEMCRGNSLMLSKLAQIARKPYIKTLTMSDIIRTIEEFNLPVEIRKGKLVFEGGPEKRWLILKLLDDDHLGSSMTKMKYRSNSKVQL